ncbi:ATP-binding cassette domain-containing protein [Microbacterium hominis]|uniref:ABC transporter ATP-binding protein n=1 Tax=Microbacterium hominis TaxID=162426 RepID=A0A7D4UIF1_9MICO|nr:ATP-binding cassette domain-containing protein [Microbacterium hominis]QKJ18387.1 ABC transporter ATP-binding protein [Microbacterium hominis]
MSGIGLDAVQVVFGDTVALDDVSLAVPEGEVTAVVGGDGAGKSTLLRVLARRVAPGSGAVHTLDAERIGYQPSTSGVWGNLSVDENIAFVGRSYGMADRAIRSRAGDLLGRAGLSEARSRLGRALSGGMRQKLGFVLAILHEPRLVLLDEPSTGVDPVSRVELWRLISEAAAGDTAVLMATTYLDEAQRAASVTALDRGRIIASGTPDEIIAGLPGGIGMLRTDAPAPPDSWRRGRERHVWLGREEGRAEPDAAAVTRIDPPDLEDALIALTISGRDEPDAESEPPQPPQPPPAATSRTSGPVVAAGRGVTRRFGVQTAVDDVSLAVHAGEIVGLIGANGAGKTTFLRALIGLDRPDEGEVELFGAPPDAASRRRLGYVPQGLGLFRTISVRENAEFFARVYAGSAATLPAALDEVSRDVVADIGLGRQRQLAFALALEHDPDLLVLDEPTSGVDPLSRARLWDTIHAQADAGRGVLVTTHYLQEAEQCTRLALMSQGRLLGLGSVADLTAGVRAVLVRSPQWQEAFTALGAVGLPTMLSGREVRVAGVDADRVRAALRGIPAEIDEVEPTLEEAMVLREG